MALNQLRSLLFFTKMDVIKYFIVTKIFQCHCRQTLKHCLLSQFITCCLCKSQSATEPRSSTVTCNSRSLQLVSSSGQHSRVATQILQRFLGWIHDFVTFNRPIYHLVWGGRLILDPGLSWYPSTLKSVIYKHFLNLETYPYVTQKPISIILSIKIDGFCYKADGTWC